MQGPSRAAVAVMVLVGVFSLVSASAALAADKVSAGGAHACSVTFKPNAVHCWGANSEGQLGNGRTGQSMIAVKVADGGLFAAAGGIVDITTGWRHTCALASNGTVFCWGKNTSGQLGNPSTLNLMKEYESSRTPLIVKDPSGGKNLSGVAEIKAGSEYTCARLTNRQVYCWGSGFYGQLGNGKNLDSPLPVAVSNISDAVALSIGVAHACAVRSTGTVSCWGDNRSGQLGDGTTANRSAPLLVKKQNVDGTTSALPGRVGVHAGDFHTCATGVTSGQKDVNCWGRNDKGQLGIGNTTNTSVANQVFVLGPRGTKFALQSAVVSGGASHTCAVDASSGANITCWGDNMWKQLGPGNPDTLALRTSPSLPFPPSTQELDAGESFTCAVAAKVTYCWGAGGAGTLGNGNANITANPTKVLYP